MDDQRRLRRRRGRRFDRRPAERFLRALAVVVVAALFAACGSSPSPSPSGSPSPSPIQGSPSPATPGRSPSPSLDPSAVPSGAAEELKALADDILEQVAALRELAPEATIKTTVLDQAGLDRYVRESFERDVTAEELAAQEGLYKRLGLLTPDASLEDLYLDLLGSQVLGLYDDTDKALYVVARGDGIGGLEKFTMSHELDHALQDQHFDLGTLVPEDTTDQSDLALARLSVAEGDATLVMSQWATQHLTAVELVEIAQAASDPEQRAILERTPAILSAPLQFPYVQGVNLVLARYQAGGWDAVDELYADPPDTSEQVIHTEKLAAHEPAVQVAIATDLAARMGDGWSVAQQDTFGEYLMGLWLEQLGIAGPTARDAAAGWGGDRLAFLSGPDGESAIVWRTMWDDEDEASQFTSAALTAGRSLGDTDVLGLGGAERWVIIGSDSTVLRAAIAAAGL